MRRRHAIAALGLACADGWAPMATAQDASGRVAVPDARLLDQGGGAHRLRTLCDQSVVIGFFYTGCSTVCPPQTAALRALRERLDARGAQGAPTRVLSISVDPLGDSPEAMRAYARRFDLRLGLAAGWLMLTGAPHELARAWKAFDVPVGDPSAHSSLLWLGANRPNRWTRANALTPAERLVDLIRQVSA